MFRECKYKERKHKQALILIPVDQVSGSPIQTSLSLVSQVGVGRRVRIYIKQVIKVEMVIREAFKDICIHGTR